MIDWATLKEERLQPTGQNDDGDIMNRWWWRIIYDPDVTELWKGGDAHYLQEMTDEEWEEFGRDISNSKHLTEVTLSGGALNDHRLSFLFRGLKRSSIIKGMSLHNNELSAAGVRSIVPFLQNSNNLQGLDLYRNNIQSEGFNILLQALRDSPIEELYCSRCGIESIPNSDSFPKHLTELYFCHNNIGIEGCRELAKLLQRGDATLKILDLEDNQVGNGVEILVEALRTNRSVTKLHLSNNMIEDDGVAALAIALQSNTTLTTLDLNNNDIGDDGVETLADALQSNATLTTLHLNKNKIGNDGVAALAATLQSNATLATLYLRTNMINDDGVETLADALKSNTSLKRLDLRGNNDISEKGKIMLLKVVIDISSIKATLQSNHTLTEVYVSGICPTEIRIGDQEAKDGIQQFINEAVNVNSSGLVPDVGRHKVIFTQLRSARRAKLAGVQGVKHSVYSEIDSLYLPEVLSLISRGKSHGLKELFPVLKSTMTELLSKVDMKVCIQKQVARHEAEIIRHEEEAAYREARIRAMISEHESMISEHESMISAHGAKIEKLNNRLKAMEDPDQNISLDTKAQSSKRRREDGFFSALSGFWRGRFKY